MTAPVPKWRYGRGLKRAGGAAPAAYPVPGAMPGGGCRTYPGQAGGTKPACLAARLFLLQSDRKLRRRFQVWRGDEMFILYARQKQAGLGYGGPLPLRQTLIERNGFMEDTPPWF